MNRSQREKLTQGNQGTRLFKTLETRNETNEDLLKVSWVLAGGLKPELQDEVPEGIRGSE